MASDIKEAIEKSVTTDTDFSKVLRDVALGLKNKGFFNDKNWTDKVLQSFGSVIEAADDSFTDNEHDISNSFVDERSKFIWKSKTSIDSTIERKSITNPINPMFEDSNESFEIPETQAFPPTDHHLNNDDSEGFITMPAEEVDANDCSQSQVILQANELGQQSPNEFHDSDSIDMEISKLEWDDSANDTGKNKSASSVTTQLDGDLVAKQAINDYDRSASVTPDLDFDALPSTLNKSIMETLASPKLFKAPSHLAGTETKNDSFSICDNELNGSSTCQTSSKLTCHEDKPLAIEKTIPPDNVDVTDDDTQLDVDVSTTNDAQISDDINKDKENVDRRINTDELFARPKDPIKELNRVIDTKTNDVIDHFDETQVFTKSGADGSVDISNGDDDGYNSIPKVHPGQNNLISSMEDNSDDNDGNKKGDHDDGNNQNNSKVNDEADTEAPIVRSKLRKRNRLIESSDEDEEEEEEHANKNPVNNKSADALNENDIFGTPTQKHSSVHRSNEKDVLGTGTPTRTENGKNVDESNDENDIYYVATQKFETLKPPSRALKCISDLKRDDWSQLCEKANSEQSTVVFKSVFDQCKDLAMVQTSDESVASVIKREIIVEAPIPQPPIRQSSRRRAKVKGTSESTDDVDASPSKRQRVCNPPVIFKAPVRKLSKASTILTKSTDVPTPKSEATAELTSSSSCLSEIDDVESTNSSAGLSKSDEVDENIDIGNLATQVFMKASSTPKEQTEPLKVSTRRQLRAVRAELPNPKAVKQLIPKLSNQSATYSPRPTGVKVKKEDVSADVNENITVPVDQSKSTYAVQSRKRKAPTDIRSVLDVSNESASSTSSSSMARSARNSSFRVMFTMVDPQPYKSSLKELNISIATSDEYNALITDKIYRTSKFMCALAAGRPIVSVKWLDELKAEKLIADPYKFLLKDTVGEKKYQFNLAKTLGEVRKKGCLFRNHSILVTPNCNPEPDILKDVITSAGGKYLKTSLVPRKDDIVLCIADEKDRKLMSQLNKKYSLTEITVEDFMQSIFQYKLAV